MAYQQFCQVFGGSRFASLAADGTRGQRPLWASTGPKNPAYNDVLYVEELIGPDTVNTAPVQTIDAFRMHGRVAVTIHNDLDSAKAVEAELAEMGIDMEPVTDKLLLDGLVVFVEPFELMLNAIEAKRQQAV